MEKEKKFKIYMYTSPSGKVYIGLTCNPLHIRAAKDGSGYKECPHFFEAIKKYGFENFTCEILKDNLTLDEANYWEEYYISQYNSTNDSFGYNLLSGGLNRKASDETKEKMRQNRLGTHHSEETKRKISEALTNRIFSEEHKKHISEVRKGKVAYIPTLEQKDYLSIKLKNHQSMSKPVRCIETGIIYASANEAARQIGLASGSHINDCITNPKRYKTAGGFHWERLSVET